MAGDNSPIADLLAGSLLVSGFCGHFHPRSPSVGNPSMSVKEDGHGIPKELHNHSD
jgi:hypothetical protein